VGAGTSERLKEASVSKNVEKKQGGRRTWQPPVVKRVGSVGDVLRGGNGKLTVLTGDPGEPQKVPSHE
jgi:hypothetical protein